MAEKEKMKKALKRDIILRNGRQKYVDLSSNFQQNSKNIVIELQKYQPILPYFFSRQSSEFLPPVQNITNMIIVGNLNF